MNGTTPNGKPRDVREAARQLRRRGLYPIPLPARSKKPAGEAWPEWRIDEDEIDERFAVDSNMGVLLGDPSGVVDVDSDSPEAIVAAPHLLPPTGMVSGRASAPTSHHWYVVDEPPKRAAEKFSDPTNTDRSKSLLLELRSTGGQSVVPPSVYPADPEGGHATAEPCVWYRSGEPARVCVKELHAAVSRVASAALIARHWPGGGRHNASLALAGGLLRAGWPEELVEAFVTAVCAAAGDTELKDRLTAVRTTAERLRNGETAAGWPSFQQAVGAAGPAVVNQVRTWLKIRREPKPTMGNGRSSETSCGRAAPKPRYVPIPAYAPFPTRCLPEPWAAFVAQGAAALKCDEALVALPVLAVLASAIGTTRRVHLGAEWFEPAVLWTCVVQESGGRKSPAAELSVDLVQARQKKQVKEYKEKLQDYKREVAEYKERADDPDRGDPPPKPLLKRSIVGDITIEKLSGILDDNRRGVLLYRDELAGWVTSFTKYKGASGASDETNWLSIHRAGPIIYDRKTGDKPTVYVPFGAASVTGGIQPGTLGRLMTAGFFESGLVARILFCMPPRTPKVWTDAGIDEGVKEQAAASLAALYDLAAEVDEDGDPKPVVVPLSRPARERMKQFVNDWGLRQFEAEGAEAAALAKLEALPGRFALIHHCVLKAGSLEDTDPVSAESLECGIALAEWFAREADRVYRTIHQSDEEKEVRRLVELVTRLADRNGGRVSVKTLQQANSRRYRTKEDAALDLERLVGLGLGAWVDGEADPKGGRRVAYFVFTPPPAEGENPGPEPCTTHDVSDDRPGDDDTDFGGASDDRPGPPEGPPPTPVPGGVVKPDPVGISGEVAGGFENRSSETSCVVQHPEARNQASVPTAAPGAIVVQTPYTLVTTAAGLSDVVTAIEDGGGVVGLDTETTGLDPSRDRVRLIQLATARGTFVVDLSAFADPRTALEEVFEVLARAGVCGHNLAFDLAFLARLGFVPGRVADTMLASQVLHAGEFQTRHGLKDVAARVLGVTLNKTEQKADWSKALTPEMLGYAARDAETPPAAWAVLRERAAAAKLSRVLDAEMAAVPAVAWASSKGVGFDRPAWEALAAEAEQKQDAVREQLDAAAPGHNLTQSRNWNAPAEVTEAFASVGVTVTGTDDATLAAIDHPIAALVREYRGLAKLVGTYGKAWLKNVAADGRVYAAWKQLGAEATGRMSCKEPNLQQLPRDPRYRRCFVAPPGRTLVKADYSQIELRIAAKLTGDKRMLAAYRSGEDIHTLTARALLGKDEVGKADRQLAKSVNFGLLYGQGAKGLMAYALGSYGVTLTEAEATAHRETFFKTYAGLRAWHQKVRNTIKAKFDADPDAVHDVRTLAGRRRLLPVAKKPACRAPYPNITEALNTPVQGTGADGLKAALALLWERRDRCPDAFPVLFVHDEIVVECDEAKSAATVEWVKAAMVDGMAPLIAPVAVEVEATVGRTWGG
ncbi:dna-directed dna polymerase : DNA polymerase OS=Meiothermus silvanus (strain ATCC 700542 / DSM 9946 / VI-R2) GN=Mesil_1349 PE=3 SV=1: Prim-Pol: DUF3987: DNA_pol_A_exo1: DNA_pol_A [Gemmataceae bacterium]|nr:dna-directed dna polymerase : DNA polymerase OS=Meiothermus silvanus (strain ATCC 700542 / DSM 9946 / VI-R2) GN=Mesil_1349 PE=3 SV=1: Prim-Pol: DUF3987: DNA_pol_A_exo1: DNA_pol_A [Gemmataceae bacterium]VTT99013.1 dna-directed dna polymerase : DNA polymerase OS=Meiothermus silvanus (strain ATCC 700542 / DSM 9946 / VI-R2) GN=Mesil_1349 PE=3 SV=1: Prim-Pol: DUF3987: DNA_pol_A_exo1: DNA_pol_A [Gemmataceae bacterium]